MALETLDNSLSKQLQQIDINAGAQSLLTPTTTSNTKSTELQFTSILQSSDDNQQKMQILSSSAIKPSTTPSMINANANANGKKLEFELQDPTIWGPPLWAVLHTFAASFRMKNSLDPDVSPDELSQAFYSLLDSLQYCIPCPTCRKHYKVYWQANPIDDYLDLDNPDPNYFLDMWITGLHNEINKHHETAEWTIDQVRKVYDVTKLFDPEESIVKPNTTNKAGVFGTRHGQAGQVGQASHTFQAVQVGQASNQFIPASQMSHAKALKLSNNAKTSMTLLQNNSLKSFGVPANTLTSHTGNSIRSNNHYPKSTMLTMHPANQLKQIQTIAAAAVQQQPKRQFQMIKPTAGPGGIGGAKKKKCGCRRQ